MSRRLLQAVDLFCGAGGTSTGLARACAAASLRLDLLAVNHNPTAIETHSANHPAARHLCESLDSVDPRRAARRIDLLVASPECTGHSIARGGKPTNDQQRATGWHVIRWAEALRPRAILVENVREWRSWGPLGSNGRPLRRLRGETFEAWLAALRSLGYSADHRLLCAADYGDPTTRERLFVLARLGRGPVRWPEPTHSPTGDADLFGVRPRWRAAREVIDWTLRGESIWNRKRPLKPKTMARIFAGLRKFGGAAFTMHTTHAGGDRLSDLDAPLKTVTGANRGEQALIEPFIIQFKGTSPDQLPATARDLGRPLGTITAGGGNFGLIEPFLLQLSQSGSNGDRTRSADQPIPTITTADDLAVVQPFLVSYYGTGGPRSLDEPLDTVTTRDRFALVTIHGKPALLDVRFRMLQPHELALAMGFPAGYTFAGRRGDQVRQIGNAVPVNLAQALCAEMISWAKGRAA